MHGVISRYGPNRANYTKLGRWMTEDLIIIGFDSEWVAQDGTSNHVLSYQYAVKIGSEMHRGIVYTEGAERKHRWKLSSLMGHAIEEARTAGVIGRVWPTRVFACAHFTQTDPMRRTV
jgi:hypothetical protein